MTGHIVRHCIFGLLAAKTRIIVTENAKVLFRANQVLRIENGSIGPSKLGRGSFDSGAEQDSDDEENDVMPAIDLNEDAGDGCSLDSVMMEVRRQFCFTYFISYVFLPGAT